MKRNVIFLLIVLFCGKSYSQILGGNLVTSTNFKGNPFIGVSGGILKEINDGFCGGGNIALQFSTGGGVGLRIPIMGEIRYFLSGNTDGFYPVVNLGFIHYQGRFYSVTFSGFALGAGVKFGGTDISFKYQSITSLIRFGHFNFQLDFWLNDGGGGKGKKRRR